MGLPPDSSDFWISGPMGVSQELQSIAKKGDRLTVFFAGGRFFMSMVIHCSRDDDLLVMDLGGSDDENEAFLKSGSGVAMKTSDGIEVKFEVSGPRLGKYDGHRAFFCKMPKRLHRLQRREFFRLQTPMTGRPLCDLALPDGSGSKSFPVLDMSLGGLCLSVPVGMSRLFSTPGMKIDGCSISHPDFGGKLAFGLETRNVRDGRPSALGKVEHSLVGCRFFGLGVKGEGVVQRYMTSLERRRRTAE